MSESFFITTPIYYVNDKPHIGHAYTSIAADVIARYMRLSGREVFFSTGTDEHGQKVEKSAQNKNISTQEFVNQIAKQFIDLNEACNISSNAFIRTTDDKHKKCVQYVWQKMEKYIYKSEYKGWYSIRDECYYDESELINGIAPTGSDVIWQEEESYFFKLSAFQQKLLELYEKHPEFIQPSGKLSEVISFVRGGPALVEGALRDLSISRSSFRWGINVPNDEKHVIYVWLDALFNYISVLGYASSEDGDYHTFWQKAASNSPIHIVGKDILRFHAVYWPAFLMACELPLPKIIFAHGWWKNEGEKMSKSIGNTIDPITLIEQFGVDATRFYLMRAMPFGNDGNFAKSAMLNSINSDLADNIGNLLQRAAKFSEKHFSSQIPSNSALNQEDIAMLGKSYLLNTKLNEIFGRLAIQEAIEAILHLSSDCNSYTESSAPWKLIKEDKSRAEAVTYTILETMRIIGIALQAFIPESANKILDILAVDKALRKNNNMRQDYSLKSGLSLGNITPVFTKFIE